MKAVNTNVLVRFLVNDDPARARSVHGLFVTAERRREAFWVPVLVVLEAIWVLESAYGVSRNELIAAENNPATDAPAHFILKLPLSPSDP